MKFVLQLVITAGAGIVLQLFLPFWSTALGAFIVSLIFARKGFVSFINGFIAIACLWGLTAYSIDMKTSSILTEKIASLFSLTEIMLILVTALLGGLVGGFGSLTGSLLGSLFKNQQKSMYR